MISHIKIVILTHIVEIRRLKVKYIVNLWIKDTSIQGTKCRVPLCPLKRGFTVYIYMVYIYIYIPACFIYMYTQSLAYRISLNKSLPRINAGSVYTPGGLVQAHSKYTPGLEYTPGAPVVSVSHFRVSCMLRARGQLAS